jgi:hypothetical protein
MALVRQELQRTARRRVSVIPRRSGPIPGATLVEGNLLASVHFSNHVLERFAQRTGLPLAGRAALEPIVKDLLLQEGLRVPYQPGWAGVQEAPFYLQAGSWLLFLGRPNPRGGAGHLTITTVVAREKRTWAEALARGEIATPPPLRTARPKPERVAVGLSIVIALRQGGSPLKLPAAINATHRERQLQAERAFDQALADWVSAARQHEAERARAREKHLARHGFLS